MCVCVCRVQKFNMIIAPRVIPGAEEVGTVLRRPYPRTARPGRRAMTTSMTHHRRRPHCKGRTSNGGLALT